MGIFFDLSRAFETINPHYLGEKLFKMGIRGSLNQWFKSYVSNRKVVVKVNDHISDPFDVDLGTPQGGVLLDHCCFYYTSQLPTATPSAPPKATTACSQQLRAAAASSGAADRSASEAPWRGTYTSARRASRTGRSAGGAREPPNCWTANSTICPSPIGRCQ
ncbi:unnamed protein product [Phaedon cochleariae]|uniref:Reverse transcriptase domain-containing protein n=1 Tax=Phaedon cochleariae TaxID=80249 RepID=A0A9N9SAB9_PHACE|nr:unnamed protein product [Phaedon cochleariae]